MKAPPGQPHDSPQDAPGRPRTSETSPGGGIPGRSGGQAPGASRNAPAFTRSIPAAPPFGRMTRIPWTGVIQKESSFCCPGLFPGLFPGELFPGAAPGRPAVSVPGISPGAAVSGLVASSSSVTSRSSSFSSSLGIQRRSPGRAWAWAVSRRAIVRIVQVMTLRDGPGPGFPARSWHHQDE